MNKNSFVLWLLACLSSALPVLLYFSSCCLSPPFRNLTRVVFACFLPPPPPLRLLILFAALITILKKVTLYYILHDFNLHVDRLQKQSSQKRALKFDHFVHILTTLHPFPPPRKKIETFTWAKRTSLCEAICLLLELPDHMIVPFGSGVQTRGNVKASFKDMKVQK